MASKPILKSPFPYFGGKSSVAAQVWSRFGEPSNYIEPFSGSAAVLLRRPGSPGKFETINDRCCYLANFWRAVQADPAVVATYADNPVSETDLSARHNYLLTSNDAILFREHMRTNPEYFDTKIAGWWAWGLCCWIGAGWCDLDRPRSHQRKRPNLGNRKGVVRDGSRVQLADAYARGRGVNANDDAELCADRRAWLVQWFEALRDRLRPVRVCCGDWRRVCESNSVTTRLGLTAVFLDPPYRMKLDDGENNRAEKLYTGDDPESVNRVVDQVIAYCTERGSNPKMRIAVCGYDKEGYEKLEGEGWKSFAWKANGGYANRGSSKANKLRERIWFSPHCLDPDVPETTEGLFKG